jgi:hypothetical protein
MSRTHRYRHQHTEIMRLATQLGDHLVPSQLAADGAEARRILSELSGKLIVHLAAEDNLLYPQLLNSRDLAARKLARRFLNEMGPLADAFKDYAVRWGILKRIQSKPEQFAEETQAIIKTLSERILRENTELYPLADDCLAWRAGAQVSL